GAATRQGDLALKTGGAGGHKPAMKHLRACCGGPSRCRFHRLVAGIALAGIMAGGARPAGGEDWPQFLGPHGTGRSDETNLVERIPPGGLPVLWSRPMGTGY